MQKPIWDKTRPKDIKKTKPLTSTQKNKAKARAKEAGRPYPNLVDNMAVAKNKSKTK